jgi:tetratricopeptide (TPR) repeat protein
MKYWIIVLLLVAGNVSFGQDQPQTPATGQQQPTAGQVLSMHYARTYQAGIRYNDYNVAKHALINILVENPQNDSILYSLSLLYYQMQNYTSAALTARDVLAMNPDNIGALEIAAVSYDNIGAKDKALETYESLYLKTDDFNTLYKIAFLQYELKNYTESKTNADILLAKKEIEELKAIYNLADGSQKEYPIRVALINLKGLISTEQGDKAAAKSFYEQALQLAPDFQLAKDNLEALK